MNRLLQTAGFLVLALSAMAMPAHAVTQYWDGGGADDNFNTPENWYNSDFAYDNLVPVSGQNAYVENGGTVIVDQDNTINKFYLAVADSSSGFAQMSAGTMDLEYGMYVGYGADSRADLQLSGGTINIATRFLLGYNSGSVGTLHQTGGSIIEDPEATQWSRIGYAQDAYGYYDMSGGELQLGGVLVGNNGGDGANIGVGVFDQSGGSFTVHSTAISGSGLRIGTNGGAMGVFNLTGGTCRVQTGYLVVGASGSYSPFGHLNISGTGHLIIDYQGVDGEGDDIGYARVAYMASSERASDGVINLGPGGTMTAPLIRTGDGVDPATAGNAYLNFHGGTLVANADQDDYLRLMDAHVYDQDAKIDTDGHDITINRALLAATDYGVQSVDLGFYGGGTGYNGPPAVRLSGGSGTGAAAVATVSGGTITGFVVTNPGSGYQAGDILTGVLFGGGADMEAAVGDVTLTANNATGGLQKLGLGTLTLAGDNTYTGDTSVQAGGLAVTGSIVSDVTVDAVASLAGSGTIDGSVDLNGTFAVAYDSDADTADLLTILDQLDLTGSTIALTDTGGGTLADGTYVIATYGSLVGTPANTVGLLSGWSLDYAYDYDGGTDNSIALIVAGTVLIPGDTNGDNKVDQTDAAVLAANWGQTGVGGGGAAGDFNGDRNVDMADASILAANWGDHTASASESAVPEPSLLAVILTGLAGLAGMCRRPSRP